MKQITTVLKDGAAWQTESEAAFLPDAAGRENEVLNLYPQVHYQTWDGFGGAFTEAVGSVLAQLPPVEAQKIIAAYYGTGKDSLGYTLARAHLDSCDFSLGNYSANNDPEDAALCAFDLAHDEKYIFPYLKQAQNAAGQKIPVLLAPWSPPAYMKTNGEKNHGGTLLPQYRTRWAKYLCRYVQEYQARGFSVHSLSVQNEPKAVQPWDSCVYTAAQERDFIADCLAPALQEAGIDVPILIWDHNKERLFDWVETIMAQPKAAAAVKMAGFHWYSGDHFEALQMVRERWPQLALILTECCVEYSKFGKVTELENARLYAHDIIGNLNAGMNASIDWNLVLDTQGGPNHAGNLCDAPILCDVENGTWHKNLSFAYIGHFSRYIKPGAVRIGKSCFTGLLETVAFCNPDGSLAVVTYCPGEQPCSYTVRIGECVAELAAPPQSLATLVIAAEEWRGTVQ